MQAISKSCPNIGNKINKTRKGVPELRRPALVCLSAIDKKSVYWSSSWARILNVQDIIKERTMETSSNIIFDVYSFHRRAGQHSFNTCLRCTWYSFEDVSLPTKFRFNVGPALQPIAGSMQVNRLRRWPNTNLSPGLLYTLRTHVAFNQCCFNADPVFDAVPSLKQHWVIVLSFLTAALCWWCFNIPAPETRYIDPMLM